MHLGGMPAFLCPPPFRPHFLQPHLFTYRVCWVPAPVALNLLFAGALAAWAGVMATASCKQPQRHHSSCAQCITSHQQRTSGSAAVLAALSSDPSNAPQLSSVLNRRMHPCLLRALAGRGPPHLQAAAAHVNRLEGGVTRLAQPPFEEVQGHPQEPALAVACRQAAAGGGRSAGCRTPWVQRHY